MDKTETTIAGLPPREARFLDRLDSKYERSESAGFVRSYLLVSVVILGMFAAARWIPWWGVALLLVEGLGLGLFHQYKRFARFKSRLLRKLWLQVKETSS